MIPDLKYHDNVLYDVLLVLCNGHHDGVSTSKITSFIFIVGTYTILLNTHHIALGQNKILPP